MFTALILVCWFGANHCDASDAINVRAAPIKFTSLRRCMEQGQVYLDYMRQASVPFADLALVNRVTVLCTGPVGPRPPSAALDDLEEAAP